MAIPNNTVPAALTAVVNQFQGGYYSIGDPGSWRSQFQLLTANPGGQAILQQPELEVRKPALQQLQSAFGMIPNIAGAMATSPVLINSLVGLFGNVHGGSFTEAQVETVLLTDAVTNTCTWAVAFHTALALEQGIDPSDVTGLRERRLPKDGKLAALSTLAKTMIEKRGRSPMEDLN